MVILKVSLPEALRCLRAYSLCPSSETVEISVNVNMALKKNKRKDAFRGTLVYPHRFGEERRVLLLAEVGVAGFLLENCARGGIFEGLKITIGHWPFSVQNCQMANHLPQWLALLADQ